MVSHSRSSYFTICSPCPYKCMWWFLSIFCLCLLMSDLFVITQCLKSCGAPQITSCKLTPSILTTFPTLYTRHRFNTISPFPFPCTSAPRMESRQPQNGELSHSLMLSRGPSGQCVAVLVPFLSPLMRVVLNCFLLFQIPFCTHFTHLFIPNAGWGFAIGKYTISLLDYCRKLPQYTENSYLWS